MQVPRPGVVTKRQVTRGGPQASGKEGILQSALSLAQCRVWGSDWHGHVGGEWLSGDGSSLLVLLRADPNPRIIPSSPVPFL